MGGEGVIDLREAILGRQRPGLTVGVLSGLVVGVSLLLGALYQGIPAYGPEFFGILVPLALFGLIYDLGLGPRAEGANHWRNTVVYWTLAYPVVRVIYDLGLYLGAAARGSGEPLSTAFPHYAGPLPFLTWAVFQATFGSAYGIGFLILYGRLRKRN